MDARTAVRRAGAAIAILAGIWSTWLVVSSGGAITLFGVVVRSHDPLRPLLLCAMSMALWLLTGGRAWLAEGAARLGRRALVRALGDSAVHQAIAVALSVFLLIIGIAYGSTTAGGADSYGYLSQAESLRRGRLSIDQPWVKDVPWPNATWSFAPLGYTPSRPMRFTLGGYSPAEQDRWAIVPTYSPGLPMLMALGKAVGGSCGPFVFAPVGGALLVLTTYLFGLRLGSSTLGLVAALLVAASPPFLLMLFVNMTDVPVAAALALACWCVMGTTMRSAFGASIALAVALLIRPNLVPVVPVFVLWLGWRVASLHDRRWHAWRAVVVLGGVALASIATSAIYWIAYGTPFESGYGATAPYFSLSHIVPNARNYASWFTEVHTPIAWLGLVALALPVKALWPAVSDRSTVIAFALMTGMVIAEFLVYLVLDNNSYLRFFLVCYPFIMLGLASVAMAISRLHRVGGPLVAAGLVIVVMVRGLSLVPEWGILRQRYLEGKLADVADHVRSATPENSVVLASEHSGSLRFYAGRVTLRWDLLPPEWLDRAVAWMAARGVHAYALLDEMEQVSALNRFKGQTLVGVLEGPPVFRFGNKRFFDLGLAPGAKIDTLELPVIDVLPRCRAPEPPPRVVWK
jgi:4-amino-4-deoxy-L-arabinose transferase-like glycosyltransferase